LEDVASGKETAKQHGCFRKVLLIMTILSMWNVRQHHVLQPQDFLYF